MTFSNGITWTREEPDETDDCVDVAGTWSNALDPALTTIAQTGCSIVATNPSFADSWSPASGTVVGNIVGLFGITGTVDSQSIKFTNGFTWTKVSGGSGSASGDPHLVNTKGETFDLFRAGLADFIVAPRFAAPGTASLTVSAFVGRLDGNATDGCNRELYITAITFGGKWLGDKVVNVNMDGDKMVAFVAGSPKLPATSPMVLGTSPVGEARILVATSVVTLIVGNASVVVAQGEDYTASFMNMNAKGLKHLGCEIGGLLGEDDHTAFSTRPESCRQQFGQALGRGATMSDTDFVLRGFAVAASD